MRSSFPGLAVIYRSHASRAMIVGDNTNKSGKWAAMLRRWMCKCVVVQFQLAVSV
jgi:hypothetical protein